MDKKLSNKQISEYIEEIYLDAKDDYENNPLEFVRRHIDYDTLIQLLFFHNGIRYTHLLNIGVEKILEYIDLSEINWYGIRVKGIDFSKTNVDVNDISKFNLQTVYKKDISRCDFSGLDLSNQNFNGVNILNTKFYNTTLPAFNPNKVFHYDFAFFEETKDFRR